MADSWHLRHSPNRSRHRPNHDPSQSPSLFPHQKHNDRQHVLPHRHRRPLGRRLRQTPQLGLPKVGSTGTPACALLSSVAPPFRAASLSSRTPRPLTSAQAPHPSRCHSASPEPRRDRSKESTFHASSGDHYFAICCAHLGPFGISHYSANQKRSWLEIEA